MVRFPFLHSYWLGVLAVGPEAPVAVLIGTGLLRKRLGLIADRWHVQARRLVLGHRLAAVEAACTAIRRSASSL
jgi:hypothetical protein